MTTEKGPRDKELEELAKLYVHYAEAMELWARFLRMFADVISHQRNVEKVLGYKIWEYKLWDGGER